MKKLTDKELQALMDEFLPAGYEIHNSDERATTDEEIKARLEELKVMREKHARKR